MPRQGRRALAWLVLAASAAAAQEARPRQDVYPADFPAPEGELAGGWTERVSNGVADLTFRGNPEVQPYRGATAVEVRLDQGGAFSLVSDAPFVGPAFPDGFDAVTFWITGPDALCLNITLDPYTGANALVEAKAVAVPKQQSPSCQLTTWRQMRIELSELPAIPWAGINWRDGGQNAATGGGSVFYLDDVRLVRDESADGVTPPPEGTGTDGLVGVPPDAGGADVDDAAFDDQEESAVCAAGEEEEFDAVYPAPFPAPEGELAGEWTERTANGFVDLAFQGNPEVQPYSGATAIEVRLDQGGAFSLAASTPFAGPAFPDGYDAVTFWITGPDALCLNITLDPFTGRKEAATRRAKQLSPSCQLTAWQRMKISLSELPAIPWAGINWRDGGQNAATGGGSVFYLDDVRLVRCVPAGTAPPPGDGAIDGDNVVPPVIPPVDGGGGIVPPLDGGGGGIVPPLDGGGGGGIVPPVDTGGGFVPPLDGGGGFVPPVDTGGGILPPLDGGGIVPPVGTGGGAPLLPVTDGGIGGGTGGGAPLLPVTDGGIGGGAPLLPVTDGGVGIGTGGGAPLLPVSPAPPIGAYPAVPGGAPVVYEPGAAGGPVRIYVMPPLCGRPRLGYWWRQWCAAYCSVQIVTGALGYKAAPGPSAPEVFDSCLVVGRALGARG